MASTTPIHATTSISGSFPVGNAAAKSFVDRRSPGDYTVGPERRQFGSSHVGLSEDGRELALAIDEYIFQHHRRYITCDEMLSILSKLGYQKMCEA